MPTLLEQLSLYVGQAFTAVGLPEDLGFVKVSDRPDLAQFQCNGAMAAAKKSGRNPRDVATQIVAELQKNPVFTKVEAVGPGFINLSVTDNFLATTLAAHMKDAHLSAPRNQARQTIMLDYGGPNVAKPMHVGHLRTAIVGDTLRRLLHFTGAKTIGDIHLGDWGLQMGIVISELESRFPDLPYFKPGFTGPFPAAPPVSFDDLGEIYPTGAAACKEDEARAERARIATLDLQKGRAGYRALWQQLRDLSVAAMEKNYGALNVHFDLWNGEASVDPLIDGMVADLKARNFAVESEGAIVIPVAQNDDKKEIPPLILVKRDGGALYATTDLATIIERAEQFHPDRIIYVVDQRQNLHFEQVFRAADKAKLFAKDKLYFAGIGTINGKDGKPFKTRAGGVMKLEDMIQMGLDKAREKMADVKLAQDMPPDERDSIALKIAVAAMKFADLKNPRHVDYIFDLDAMTSFEGRTGPYMLYQAVRIKSILRKAQDQGAQPPSTAPAISEIDRDLALLLVDFPHAITASVDNLSAHILADYLHRLAQEFATFYNKCHILSETDATKQANWLGLCAMTLTTLKTGLELMGIDIPDKM